MREWNIYLNGHLVDTVFYIEEMDEWDVYRELINNDGYPRDIELSEVK